MRRLIHIIVGILVGGILGGILLILTLPRSGEAAFTLVAWGILLVALGAIVGAILGARKRGV